MAHRLLLPQNFTDADVVAAVEGAVQDALNCRLLARIPEPADMLNHYEEVRAGKAGNLTFSLMRHIESGTQVLYMATVGYFSLAAE